MEPLRIVLGGVRDAGKSTFAVSLWLALERDPDIESVSLHELDPYSDSHAVIAGLKRPEDRIIRRRVDFERTLVPMIQSYRNDPAQVVLGDLPGKLANPRMGEMVAHATHAILLGRERVPGDDDGCPRHRYRSVDEWSDFLGRRGIPVIARVHSLLTDQELWDDFLPIEGLERRPMPEHPTIQAICEVIKNLLSGDSA